MLDGGLLKPLDCLRVVVGGVYLIICDSISQVLDEAIQDVGVVGVVQKLHEPILSRKRSELGNNLSQLPENNQDDLGICDCFW